MWLSDTKAFSCSPLCSHSSRTWGSLYHDWWGLESAFQSKLSRVFICALESGLVIEQPPQVSLTGFDRHIHCLSLNSPGFQTLLINQYLFHTSQQSLPNPVSPLYLCFLWELVSACVCARMSSSSFVVVRLWSVFYKQSKWKWGLLTADFYFEKKANIFPQN